MSLSLFLSLPQLVEVSVFLYSPQIILSEQILRVSPWSGLVQRRLQTQWRRIESVADLLLCLAPSSSTVIGINVELLVAGEVALLPCKNELFNTSFWFGLIGEMEILWGARR